MINTLRQRRNEQHFADDIFKRIYFNENVWISIKISLKFVPKGPINIIPALVQIMAWRRSGDKPLSEPMMVSLPTHICVTRPQWVKVSYAVILIWAVKSPQYYDVIKWKHFSSYWPFVRRIHQSPVNSPHKGQWHGALMFSFICTWING